MFAEFLLEPQFTDTYIQPTPPLLQVIQLSKSQAQLES